MRLLATARSVIFFVFNCRNVNDDTVVIGPVVRHRYEPPARLLPPPGVEDFDKECGNDPNVCSEYAMDIFNYYKSREVRISKVHIFWEGHKIWKQISHLVFSFTELVELKLRLRFLQIFVAFSDNLDFNHKTFTRWKHLRFRYFWLFWCLQGLSRDIARFFQTTDIKFRFSKKVTKICRHLPLSFDVALIFLWPSQNIWTLKATSK
jgi:hypothetical protein